LVRWAWPSLFYGVRNQPSPARWVELPLTGGPSRRRVPLQMNNPQTVEPYNSWARPDGFVTCKIANGCDKVSLSEVALRRSTLNAISGVDETAFA
jgi:hypothetical protein